VNVADFVENDQAQGLADTGHRLQQRILAAGDFFGLPLEFLLQGEDLLIEMPDHCQVVFEGDLAQGMVLGRQELFFPGIAGAAGLPGGDSIVGQLVGVDAGQQLGAPPDIEDALAQERAQRPLLRRIDAGRGMRLERSR